MEVQGFMEIKLIEAMARGLHPSCHHHYFTFAQHNHNIHGREL